MIRAKQTLKMLFAIGALLAGTAGVRPAMASEGLGTTDSHAFAIEVPGEAVEANDSAAEARVPACQRCLTYFQDEVTGLYWGWAGDVCDPEDDDDCADCNFGLCNGEGWYTHDCSVGCTPPHDLLQSVVGFVESRDGVALAILVKNSSNALRLDRATSAVVAATCTGTDVLRIQVDPSVFLTAETALATLQLSTRPAGKH